MNTPLVSTKSTLSARAPCVRRYLEVAAPDLACALNDEFDINRGPVSLNASPPTTDPASLQSARANPVNCMQDLLHLAAKNLEPLAGGTSVEQHLQALLTSKITQSTSPPAGSAGNVASTIMQKVLARFAPSAAAEAAVNATTIYHGR